MVKAAARVALAVATVLYPLLVFYALTHWGLEVVSALVACGGALFLAVRWRQDGRGAKPALTPMLPPAIVVLGASVSWWLSEPRLLLFAPVAVNAALCLTFVGSLAAPAPIIERYARLIHPDLSLEEAHHCRQVTRVWCAFFAINAAVTAALACVAPMSWWALYTGLGAYIAMGSLFAGEYLVRKRRFGRFGPTWGDRLLAHLLLPKGKP